MKLFKQFLLANFCCISTLVFSQNTNIFLQRNFWKTNPSIELINQKIQEKNNATALNSHGFDAVTYAILENVSNATIKYLLSLKGNGIEKLTHDKRTYVFWAAYKGNVGLVKHFIKNNAKVNIKDSHHFSPLTFAAATGQTNIEIYNLFIKNGIDIKNDFDENGANALLLAMPHFKDFKLIDFFISKGLSLKSEDNHGNGAFNYAAKKGNKTMLELLIKKGISYKGLNKNGGNAFLLASKGSRNGYNSLAFFKYLETIGINPDISNIKGETPLHNLAYGNKDIAIFKYFLSKGIAVNKTDSQGNTALINAASRNSLAVIKLLASKTKNINQTNKKEESALTKSLKNSPDVIEFLLKKGADISVIDAKGNGLNYHLFKTFNDKKEAEFEQKLTLLETKGLQVDKAQKDGNTLYHLAVQKQHLVMLKFIKKYKIDINAKNKKGLTALQEAVLIAKNSVIIKYLIAQGANKNVKTAFQETLYDLAAENEVLKNTDINFLK
ncbi:ankyrin repeat domain-containing protein [Tenacibaculum dicentrarchi]|uniref:ankyrin repeat domain-containing protein n=1 Tax=Tenacibaculum dicentrarchi TaxID=669041 RepID=UPI0035173EB4